VTSDFDWLKFFCFWGSLAFLGVSPVSVADTNPVKLTLHQKVNVISTPIRLGDIIANIEGQLNPKQLKVLNELKLKPAPLPGRPAIELTNRSVGVYLRIGRSDLESVGLSPDHIEVESSSSVLVGRKSHHAETSQLEKFVVAQVEKELNVRFSAEYEIRIERPIRKFVLPFGKIRYSLRALPMAFLSGSLNAYVDVFVNEDRKKSIVVPLSIEMTAQVVIAKQEIKRYQLISASMLAQEKRTIANIRKIPLMLSNMLDCRAKIRIQKGEILLGGDVELTPKVLIGSVIPITVQVNGVSVRATGKALADARVGDQIKVVNQASRKIVVGIVTASGEVEVKP
jgi:flagella basal body P-ring formation protein FlgA